MSVAMSTLSKLRRFTMRPRFLGGAAAIAAGAAIALIPVGAGAAPRHVFRHRAVTIHAVPNPISAGDPVLIFGRLFGRHRGDRLVVLFHHVATARGGFSPVQT